MSLEALLAEVEGVHRTKNRRLIGLTEQELVALEAQVGVELPTCIRSTLARVGLLTNPFGMHERSADWANANEGMRDRIALALEQEEIDPESDEGTFLQSECLVSFARDNAENRVALAASDANGADVLVFDAELGELHHTGQTFEDWCREQWSERSSCLDKPRRWQIQFSFQGNPDEQIRRLAHALGGASAGPWSPAETSPAGVTSRHLQLMIGAGGPSFRVGRMEYAGWPAPMLSLDASDSETDIENGWIVRFRRAFEAAKIAVTEVDYGLLAEDDADGRD